MVETNINIADEKNGQAGGGKTTADNFSSQDGSVVIVQDGEVIDLSVPVVTEERDGLETSLDKRLADHSYNNIMILEQTFETPEEASAFLCSKDPQYYPVAGQMMQYSDRNGNLHLVRFNGSYIIDRTGRKSSWGDIVFDKRNNCYLLFEKVTASSLRFARCYNSPYWTINNHSASYKYWRFIGTNNIGSIVMTGNDSNVMALTIDGGNTFTEMPTMRSGYHWSIKEARKYLQPYETFIDVVTKSYSFSSNTTSWIDQYIFDANGNFLGQQNLQTIPSTRTMAGGIRIAKLCDAEFVRNDNGSYSFYVIFQDLQNNRYLTDLENRVLRVDGGYKVTYTDNGELLVYPNEADRAGAMNSYRISTDFEILETYPNCHSLVYTDKGIVEIRHDSIKVDGVDVEIPVPLGNMMLTSGAWNGKNNVMVITGTHEDIDNKGNYGFLIDLDKKRIINNEKWEEIPVIPDGIEGLISVKGNKIYEAKFGDKLRYENGSLNVDYSDKCEEYKNFRMTAYGNKEHFELWSISARQYLLEGQLVYSDESCTEVAGTITRIGSLNNPNDVYVRLSGATQDELYLFHESKVPNTIATTKALMELKDKLQELENKINK